MPKTAKAPGSTKIDPKILEELRQLKYDGHTVTIANKLDRATYQAVNKVLEAMGGKWSRSGKVHVFPEEARGLLEDVIFAGEYIDQKKEYQFFETPVAVAAMLYEIVRNYFKTRKVSTETIDVLEPSAGKGRIVQALLSLGKHTRIEMYELNPRLINVLVALKQKHGERLIVHNGDFLAASPCDYDAIVMNPPFAGLGDVKHVNHAYKFLADGGILVAIMCPAWTYRSDKIAVEFREFVERVNGTWEMLPDNSFAESGTNVRTGILTIVKD